MSNNNIAVFFYGLFMDESLLASRGIHASDSTLAHLDGYNLRIGRRATLVPDGDGRAHGVLMKLKAHDLETLYADETVADYVAETVSVVLPDGSRAPAVCYILPAHKLEGSNATYARALLELADKLDLPDEYLAQIRQQIMRV